MIVKIDVLQSAVNKLLDHAREVEGESIVIDADYYWFVPMDLVYQLDARPDRHTLGSLWDDWSEMEGIERGSRDALGYPLVWASALLRAVGEGVPCSGSSVGGEAALTVKTEVLQSAVNKLFDHAREVEGDSIDIDVDRYWFVPMDLIYQIDARPDRHTLGSLSADWSAIEGVERGSRDALGYGLVWTSALLRAVGERVRW
ncbi:MAG: hypothetical protein FWD57_16655 [Polyangiaceae bacterium]|nr:hypothetical protein [Polyangiaceae bacterium]